MFLGFLHGRFDKPARLIGDFGAWQRGLVAVPDRRPAVDGLLVGRRREEVGDTFRQRFGRRITRGSEGICVVKSRFSLAYLEQGLRLAQIGGIMPLGEPRHGRLQQGTRLGVPLLASATAAQGSLRHAIPACRDDCDLATARASIKLRFRAGVISQPLRSAEVRPPRDAIPHPSSGSRRPQPAGRSPTRRAPARSRRWPHEPPQARYRTWAARAASAVSLNAVDAGLQFGNALARPSALDQKLAMQPADGRAPPRRPMLLADLQQFRGRRLQILHVATIRCKQRAGIRQRELERVRRGSSDRAYSMARSLYRRAWSTKPRNHSPKVR